MNTPLSSILKIIGIAVAALIAIIIAAIILLPSLVNTSTFKESLIEQVKARTGQTLTIEGDLSLSVFPWLGIKTGKVTLSQAPDISDQDLVKVESTNIGVKLLPLFQKRIEVGQITLEAPVLHYVVNQKGKTSLDSFLESASASTVPASTETIPENNNTNKSEANNEEQASLNAKAITISGITIIDGQLIYEDKQKNEKHKVSALTIETGNLLSNTDAPFTLSAQVKPSNSELMFIAVDANANIDIDSGVINANSVNATVSQQDNTTLLKTRIESILFDQKKETVKTKSISLTLNSKDFSPTISIPFSDINLKTYSTSVIEFLVSEPNSKIEASGDIFLKDWNINPMIKGQVKTKALNPSAVIDLLEIDYKPSDAKSLKTLLLSTHFSGSTSGVSLHSIEVMLDDSKLTGDVSITDFETPRYRFDLSLDSINLDRYMPMAENEGKAKHSGDAGLAIAAPIPLFKKLTANGIFRADTIQANGAKLNDIRVGIASKNQQVIITPTAKLYEGETKGTITFNETKERSTLAIKNRLSNVNLASLLRDTEITDQVSGKATVDIDVNILDKNGLQTNNGVIELLVNNGALKGVDIKKVLDDTQEFVDRLRGKTNDEKIESQTEGQSTTTDETRFAEMTATLNLDNNVITNKNLSIKAPAFRISGKGTIELKPKKLDYLTNIAIVNTNSGQGGEDRENLKGAIVPVRFYGNISEPKYKIDTRALIKENTKKEVEKKKDELKEKALEKLGLKDNDSTAKEDDKSTKDQLKDDLKKKLLNELFR